MRANHEEDILNIRKNTARGILKAGKAISLNGVLILLSIVVCLSRWTS